MLRNHRNGHSDRASFLAYVAEHSDAARNIHLVDPRTGSELTLYRSKSGHVLGEAAYPANMRPTYRVKVAHALAALLVGASLLCGGTVQAGQSGARHDSLEVESHAWTIGWHHRCRASVSTLDNGQVWVRVTRPDHSRDPWQGPYPSEQIGMAHVLGAFGRGC